MLCSLRYCSNLAETNSDTCGSHKPVKCDMCSNTAYGLIRRCSNHPSTVTISFCSTKGCTNKPVEDRLKCSNHAG